MHPLINTPGTSMASGMLSPFPDKPGKTTGLGDHGKSPSPGKCHQDNLESTVSQKFLTDHDMEVLG